MVICNRYVIHPLPGEKYTSQKENRAFGGGGGYVRELTKFTLFLEKKTPHRRERGQVGAVGNVSQKTGPLTLSFSGEELISISQTRTGV